MGSHLRQITVQRAAGSRAQRPGDWHTRDGAWADIGQASAHAVLSGASTAHVLNMVSNMSRDCVQRAWTNKSPRAVTARQQCHNPPSFKQDRTHYIVHPGRSTTTTRPHPAHLPSSLPSTKRTVLSPPQFYAFKHHGEFVSRVSSAGECTYVGSRSPRGTKPVKRDLENHITALQTQLAPAQSLSRPK